MRLGKFAIQGDRFRRHDYELMRAIQKDMVVLDIEYNRYQGVATYTAEHPAFDDVIEGAITPSYEVVIEKLHDGSIAPVTFKRITE